MPPPQRCELTSWLGVELGARMPYQLVRWFEPDTFYPADPARLTQ